MDIKKLVNFVDSELNSELQQVLFAQDQTGKYYILGKYVIAKRKSIYKVYLLTGSGNLEFSSLKNATAWCILDNAKKYRDARRIENLDLKLSSIDVDIAVHKNKIKSAKSDFTILVSVTKLQEDTYKRRMIMQELSGYIDNSKKIQDNNFRTKDSKIKHLR